MNDYYNYDVSESFPREFSCMENNFVDDDEEYEEEFKKILYNFKNEENNMLIDKYLLLMFKKTNKESNNNHKGISIHEIIRMCKLNEISMIFICNLITDIIWNYEQLNVNYEVKVVKNNEKVNINGYTVPNYNTFKLFYELNNLEYSVLRYYFKRTGNYKYIDIIEYVNYLDVKFNTNRFSKFASKIDYSRFLNDILSIHPNKIESTDIPIFSQIKYETNVFIENCKSKVQNLRLKP